MMQNRQANGTTPQRRNSGSFSRPTSASISSNSKPYRRTNSGSFQKTNSGSFQKTNSGSFSKRDSVPLAENPYARSSSAIYTGGERAIFRNHEVARRNGFILRVMVGLCILMLAVIIGFALGKGSGLAEADSTPTEQGAASSLAQEDKDSRATVEPGQQA